MKRTLFRAGRVLVISYAVLLLLVAGCQRSLLYHPSKSSEDALIARAMRAGMEPWRDAGGTLIGWRKPNAAARNRLLVFHGNAGFALHRTYYADGFGADWEVYLMEYPGYGSRDGSPGKDEFIAAGRAAAETLLAADKRPVFVLGESIGSGVAAAVAGAMPGRVRGAVLMIPFARLTEVAQEKLPFLPAGALLRDKYDNIAALAGFTGPVVVIIASDDEVIGAEQGRKLYDALTTRKRLIVLEGAGHNSFPTEPGAPWFGEAGAFLLAR